MNYLNKKVSSPHVDFVDVLKANAIMNIFIQTWVHRESASVQKLTLISLSVHKKPQIFI
jgi:hypothetical protein